MATWEITSLQGLWTIDPSTKPGMTGIVESPGQNSTPDATILSYQLNDESASWYIFFDPPATRPADFPTTSLGTAITGMVVSGGDLYNGGAGDDTAQFTYNDQVAWVNERPMPSRAGTLIPKAFYSTGANNVTVPADAAWHPMTPTLHYGTWEQFDLPAAGGIDSVLYDIFVGRTRSIVWRVSSGWHATNMKAEGPLLLQSRGTFTLTVTYTPSGPVPPSGTASGAWSFSGTASGTAPAVAMNSGTASGAWSFSGTASGSRASTGTASGSWTVSGTASGSAPVELPYTQDFESFSLGTALDDDPAFDAGFDVFCRQQDGSKVMSPEPAATGAAWLGKNLALDSTFFISFDLYMLAWPTGLQYMVWHNSNANEPRLYLDNSPQGLYAQITTNVATALVPLSLNTWYSVVWTYDGGTNSLSVTPRAGGATTTETVADTIAVNVTQVRFGHRYGNLGDRYYIDNIVVDVASTSEGTAAGSWAFSGAASGAAPSTGLSVYIWDGAAGNPATLYVWDGAAGQPGEVHIQP